MSDREPMGRDPGNRAHLVWQFRVARLLLASIGKSRDPNDYPALAKAIGEIADTGRMDELPAALITCCSVTLTETLGGVEAARNAVTGLVCTLIDLLEDDLDEQS